MRTDTQPLMTIGSIMSRKTKIYIGMALGFVLAVSLGVMFSPHAIVGFFLGFGLIVSGAYISESL